MNDSDTSGLELQQPAQVLDKTTKNNVEVLVLQLEELQRLEQKRHKIAFISSTVIAMTMTTMMDSGLIALAVAILVYALSLIAVELAGRAIQYRANKRITTYIKLILSECATTHQTIFAYVHQNYVMLRSYNNRYLKTT